MTDPLSPSRFAELADAYGGVIARWPQEVRAAALAIARKPAMQAILAEAERLDARLDEWRVAAPSPRLRDRIVASRPILLFRRAKLWWSSLVVATTLAGAVTGSVAAAAMLAPPRTAPDEATAFGDFAPQED